HVGDPFAHRILSQSATVSRAPDRHVGADSDQVIKAQVLTHRGPFCSAKTSVSQDDDTNRVRDQYSQSPQPTDFQAVLAPHQLPFRKAEPKQRDSSATDAGGSHERMEVANFGPIKAY